MKARALNFETPNLRYTGLLGTGGIGSGKIFKLHGDHTLGREESRSGHFLDVKEGGGRAKQSRPFRNSKSIIKAFWSLLLRGIRAVGAGMDTI